MDHSLSQMKVPSTDAKSGHNYPLNAMQLAAWSAPEDQHFMCLRVFTNSSFRFIWDQKFPHCHVFSTYSNPTHTHT